MCALKAVAKYRDLIYDFGMDKGWDTDYYLRKGFRVIGFEADPVSAGRCRERFAKEVRDGTLTIIEGAVLEQPPGKPTPKTVKFYRYNDKSGWGTVMGDWADRNDTVFHTPPDEIVEVAVVDLPKCLLKHGVPHYAKIDIEGMDTVVLKTFLEFDVKPNYISIESNKVSYNKILEELNLLEQLGYSGFKAVQQLDVPKQKEPNPAREGRYLGYSFFDHSGLFGKDLPGDWKSVSQIAQEYKFIALQYKLFGDQGLLKDSLIGKAMRKGLSLLTRKPVPGWYDTHARHSSITM
jgi:FkbM family methyltransferase